MKYRNKMQMLYENEAFVLFNSLPDKMIRHHIKLTKSKKNIGKIKKYWEKRVEYSWRKFLFSEVDLF